MRRWAGRFGNMLSSFTGEHVGEPRLLVCLYDEPLVHVDIKFLTLPEFYSRVEDPVILFERTNALSSVISSTKPEWPRPDYQWIEDRFWVWIHYITGKIRRGEFFEALDGLSIIRKIVLSPLLQILNKQTPNGLRKLEMKLPHAAVDKLKRTTGALDRTSLITSLHATITLYRELRNEIFPASIEMRKDAEKKSIEYLENTPVS
jgi:hypothetical protein